MNKATLIIILIIIAVTGMLAALIAAYYLQKIIVILTEIKAALGANPVPKSKPPIPGQYRSRSTAHLT